MLTKRIRVSRYLGYKNRCVLYEPSLVVILADTTKTNRIPPTNYSCFKLYHYLYNINIHRFFYIDRCRDYYFRYKNSCVYVCTKIRILLPSKTSQNNIISLNVLCFKIMPYICNYFEDWICRLQEQMCASGHQGSRLFNLQTVLLTCSVVARADARKRFIYYARWLLLLLTIVVFINMINNHTILAWNNNINTYY